jgi:predicted metal-dependent TIM-barrel fold hydrolase
MTDHSTQIDQIKQANSLEEIRDVSRQFSANATGEGGILYSRPVGSVNSEVIALELAKETGLPIINKTPRAEKSPDNCKEELR